MFGSPETTTGGRALKFYASIRIDIRRKETIKLGDKPIGAVTKAKVVKNKVAAPFREAEMKLFYGFGLSREEDLLQIGVREGIVEKSGSWYSYKGERLGQGGDGARQFLIDNPEIVGKLETELRLKLFGGTK